MPALAKAAQDISVYVCAHPDDCILFMNPELYDDMQRRDGTTVLLYITAGDAGHAFRADSRSYPTARARAAMAATRWMAADAHAPNTGAPTSPVSIRGHRIGRWVYGRTVSYFLQLPDGNYAGEGFARYGFQSLSRLQAGAIRRITSIDGTATYDGWADLVQTLAAVLAREAGEAYPIRLHLAEPDAGLNPGDHADHLQAGAAARAALVLHRRGQACDALYQYVDYAIADRPANLSPDDWQTKAGSFAVLTATLRRLSGINHWDGDHLPYLARRYARRVGMQTPCPNRPARPH